jgi:hypothetical protein
MQPRGLFHYSGIVPVGAEESKRALSTSTKKIFIEEEVR